MVRRRRLFREGRLDRVAELQKKQRSKRDRFDSHQVEMDGLVNKIAESVTEYLRIAIVDIARKAMVLIDECNKVSSLEDSDLHDIKTEYAELVPWSANEEYFLFISSGGPRTYEDENVEEGGTFIGINVEGDIWVEDIQNHKRGKTFPFDGHLADLADEILDIVTEYDVFNGQSYISSVNEDNAKEIASEYVSVLNKRFDDISKAAEAKMDEALAKLEAEYND